mmetsp:Transcript_107983/g.168826  ORF Transcript_107983/g.168826 Transcript_107983/m.168826 type:complete len:291 (+) Transcript_107983:110-982(+)
MHMVRILSSRATILSKHASLTLNSQSIHLPSNFFASTTSMHLRSTLRQYEATHEAAHWIRSMSVGCHCVRINIFACAALDASHHATHGGSIWTSVLFQYHAWCITSDMTSGSAPDHAHAHQASHHSSSIVIWCLTIRFVRHSEALHRAANMVMHRRRCVRSRIIVLAWSQHSHRTHDAIHEAYCLVFGNSARHAAHPGEIVLLQCTILVHCTCKARAGHHWVGSCWCKADRSHEGAHHILLRLCLRTLKRYASVAGRAVHGVTDGGLPSFGRSRFKRTRVIEHRPEGVHH